MSCNINQVPMLLGKDTVVTGQRKVSSSKCVFCIWKEPSSYCEEVNGFEGNHELNPDMIVQMTRKRQLN